MKKLTALVFSGVALAAGLLSTPVYAAVLYTNGPVNGLGGAVPISDGAVVFNSFALTSNAIVTGVNFGGVNSVGDRIVSVDWAIRSLPDAKVLAGGTAATLDTFLFHNPGSTDVYQDFFGITPTQLLAGNYLLELQNAVTVQGGSGFWDENGGPSGALANGINFDFPSESFDILGTVDSGVPEPATWALMIGGFGLAGAVLRRRRTAVGA
jgi:hypothetical protein